MAVDGRRKKQRENARLRRFAAIYSRRFARDFGSQGAADEGGDMALMFAVVFYFTPPMIALARGHRSATAILALTVLLGWTGIGWIVAFVWSLTGNTRSAAAPVQQVVVNTTVAASSHDGENALLRQQLAALQRQSAGWAGELESISRAPAVDSQRRVEIIGALAHKSRRVVQDLREEAAQGVAARGPEPAALGPPTPLLKRQSNEGHAYWRNEIPPPLAEYPLLSGPGLYELAIAGCSHRQIELDQIAGGRRDAPVFFRTNALVYAEPDNSYDRNAVAVDIGGWRVGYIPREDAKAFGEELAALAGPGALAARALIENGFPEWRVKLDLSRPLRLA
jgi:hypothetical protein